MESPSVKTAIKDARTGVTYVGIAYRKLTDREMMGCIASYHQSKGGRKKLKSGTVIEIHTIIGYDE